MSNRWFQVLAKGESPDPKGYDAYIAAVETRAGLAQWSAVLPSHLAEADRKTILDFAKRIDSKPEAGKMLSFDPKPLHRWTLVAIDKDQTMFQLLGLARQLMKPLKDLACRRILIDLRQLGQTQVLPFIDAVVAAQRTLQFKAPKYQQKPVDSKAAPATRLDLLLSADQDREAALQRAQAVDANAAAANEARYLIMQAGNDLTPKRYVATLKKLATEGGLGFEFISQKKLQTLGAGAFLAVAQGSAHEDAGIVKLTYEPTKKKGIKLLCLVGKGITFDTGGTNLKSAAYMWGMHRDMAGSAVAYALVQLASREKWPMRVTAYLAIADNATGSRAYRQNDVVTALSGKTIEIVHTDAEGRMVLADTLHLAAKEKPDLILDFATLTGACVAAISTVYAGAFTNRPAWHPAIISAGAATGERLWPFPLDPDFGECLKSDIADIKQCRLTGGVDHIEAAIFLQEFVGKDVPWIHLDLAAAENSGGLAHVDTEVTGFGVRVGERLIKALLLESEKSS